ncbi:TPA: hypothetical protein N0F65_005176 [Lagenidium giganteum]|uniref:Nucleotide-sugar transporter n=1 Tax=Lagenidium giganteum TaxID=4803 RepID=A0AAV2YZ28_9STRA|nr:TPA: hypothetical protein N0F65_005176 [Lagenidium giganteum]
MPSVPASPSKEPSATMHERLRAYFTPLVLKKMVLLAVLSVQIGFQPLLMGWYAKEATSVSLRVGVIEALKFAMALLPLLSSGLLLHEIKQWTFQRALQTTAAPALIYVLQNYLNQTAVVVLDGVTFNILNQTKIIWTALLVYVMLRQHQSKQQVVALGILCAAAVIMTTAPSQKAAPSTSVTMAPHDNNNGRDAAFFTGAYQALIAAILSALAGTIIQRALQQQKRNAYIVTVELSLLGELTLLLWTLTSGNGAATKDENSSIWDGWTIMTVFALVCQATGGVVVGFVIKYCGNVEKSFAVVFGMIITALLENRYNGKPFGERGLLAIAMVTASTIIYTMYPPKQPVRETILPPVLSNKEAKKGRSKKHSATAEDLECPHHDPEQLEPLVVANKARKDASRTASSSQTVNSTVAVRTRHDGSARHDVAVVV